MNANVPNNIDPKTFKAVLYSTDYKHKIAYITLNRPSRYNAISMSMPFEIKQSVMLANNDNNIHVIILRGNGKFFCSGYDLIDNAQSKDVRNNNNTKKTVNPCIQELPWDPNLDHTFMGENNVSHSIGGGFTSCFMSLFESKKPTIACVHGGAVAGGSDIALCCDLLLMTDDSKIGYPPTRLWGVPTTAMWAMKVGIQNAKYLLLTGKLINGIKAKEMGLALFTYKNKDVLYDETFKLACQISSVPLNQLWFNKSVLNVIADSQYNGIKNVQLLASILDGASRHTTEGMAFQKYCQKYSFKQAIKKRDSTKIDDIPEMIRDYQNDEQSKKDNVKAKL